MEKMMINCQENNVTIPEIVFVVQWFFILNVFVCFSLIWSEIWIFPDFVRFKGRTRNRPWNRSWVLHNKMRVWILWCQRTRSWKNRKVWQQDSSAVDWSPRTGVSVLLKRPLHKRASRCHIWMHVEAVIVYDVEELMARLFIVTEPLKRSVLPPPFPTSMTVLLLLCNALLSLSEALISVLHLNAVVIVSQYCHGWHICTQL